MAASLILGFVDGIKPNKKNSWLLKGLSTGFCGCASTFGSLIAVSAYTFLLGIHEGSFFVCAISLTFVFIGIDASVAAYDTGCCLFSSIRSLQDSDNKPVVEIEMTETTLSSSSVCNVPVEPVVIPKDSLVGQCVMLSVLLCFELLFYIALIPLYAYTSLYLFGFIFTLVGVTARYVLTRGLNSVINHFYLGTFICNVIGSIVAAVIKMVSERGPYSFVVGSLILSIGDGLSSALTTMSTFAKESQGLKRNNFGFYCVYSLSTVISGFGFSALVFALSPDIYSK